DLGGVLLQEGGWHHLNIPAIADAPHRIALGEGRFKLRDPNDLLDPCREPADVLAGLKTSMGTLEFSAQYLQQPVPAEGNLIRREWLKYYQSAPDPQLGDMVIISWDTAMKATESADYSVGTVWLMQKENTYLLDLLRGRHDYPELKRLVIASQNR